MEFAEPGREEFFLLTSMNRPLPSLVTIGVAAGILAGDIAAAIFVHHRIGGWAGWLALTGIALVGFMAFWALMAHLEYFSDWARWRRRPVPAMRMTPGGLDYSAGFTGT